MSQDPSTPADEPCKTCPPDGICLGCIERLRATGVPERTLEWLQLDKQERIETVMF